MNRYQEQWWHQAKSDHEAFILLKSAGIAQCHTLHYLQMVTEKIAKAYFWRSGSPPPRSHAGFVHFLRFLGQIRQTDRERIATLFTFTNYNQFQSWLRSVLPIAYDLERIAPALANNGPNTEYPWPHATPSSAPVNHDFSVWKSLTKGQGRDLMRLIQIAVNRFPEYADT
ncbi:hypothetical protein [Gimesia sp.]|uniref:hypothetical protein n=1 Tax=Gimesia sp. TaxID=2024833 RepID=UPI003A8DC025